MRVSVARLPRAFRPGPAPRLRPVLTGRDLPDTYAFPRYTFRNRHGKPATAMADQLTRTQLLSRAARGGAALAVAGAALGPFTGLSAADPLTDGDLAYARLLVATELLGADFYAQALGARKAGPLTLLTFATVCAVLGLLAYLTRRAGATVLVAASMTLLMGLYARLPFAVAPGMGINAFFTFTIVLGKGVPWSEALGMVFVNGVIFLALSVTGVREKIIAAIPHALKIAVTCGIGLFIAFIGLKNGGVIVANPATFVSHGNFASGPVALCLFGIILTAILIARRVTGGIVISIAVVTLLGLVVLGEASRLASIPGSANVLDAKALEASRVFTINEAIRKVPGI